MYLNVKLSKLGFISNKTCGLTCHLYTSLRTHENVYHLTGLKNILLNTLMLILFLLCDPDPGQKHNLFIADILARK